MNSLDQLRRWRDTMKSTVAKMQPEKERFFAEKARIEADGTRHRDYIMEKVDEARDKAFATFGKPTSEVRILANAVAAETTAWRSIPFLLSRVCFDKTDAPAENGTRRRWYAELSNMPAPLFALVVADLKRTGNLAGLYQAYLVSYAKSGQPGWPGVDLSDVTIPDQREALDIITECSTVPVAAEQIVGEVSGRLSGNPLAMARALQPRPLQPTVGFDDERKPAPMELAQQAVDVDHSVPPQERLTQYRAAIDKAAA